MTGQELVRHPTSVLVGLEEVADAGGVGDDMAYVREGRKSGVRGYQRLGPSGMCCRGQDCIERPSA